MAKYCLKISVLHINVLCIIVSSIRDLYMMQGQECQDGNDSGRGKRLRVLSCC